MNTANQFSLLRSFRALFEGNKYTHRDSSLGDWVASHLYEDLYSLNRSPTLRSRIELRQCVVNTQNRAIGKASRRGDGTFGELVPVAAAITDPDFVVGRGPVANIEIGAETKILAKAMIKQIDRVIGDLIRQTSEFKRTGDNPICVAIVGVNRSPSYTSYERDRAFPTDGKEYKHPAQEAADAIKRLAQKASPSFDEFLLLSFSSTNIPPFPFQWLNEAETTLNYSALLTRISREYDRRFA